MKIGNRNAKISVFSLSENFPQVFYSYPSLSMRQYEENRHDNYTCLYSKELGGSLTLSLSLFEKISCVSSKYTRRRGARSTEQLESVKPTSQESTLWLQVRILGHCFVCQILAY